MRPATINSMFSSPSKTPIIISSSGMLITITFEQSMIARLNLYPTPTPIRVAVKPNDCPRKKRNTAISG